MTTVFLKSLSKWILLFSAGINAALAQPGHNTLEVHVGIYAPFSNKQAFIGRNMLGAIEMARDKSPNQKLHYSFYTLDELPAQNPKTARTVQKFIETHKINVLLTQGSKNGLMVAPLAKKNKILHFSMASDPKIADGINNFLAWSPEYEQASVLVNTLKQKHVHEIGIIASEEHSDKVLSQSIINEIQHNSTIKVLVKEQVSAHATNYTALIKQLKSKTPDLYVILASPKQIESIQTAMNSAHINKPITSIVERVTPEVMNAFNQQWYVDTHEMKPEFIKEYQEVYMNYPTTEAGYAFDVFNIVNKSILASTQQSPNFSVASIATQIHNLEMKNGVMGRSNFDAHGVLYTQSEVKIIKDGHVVV